MKGRLPSPPKAPGRPANGEPRLGPDIQAKIGKQIARVYEDILKQKVPDRFRNLLESFEVPAKKN